MSRDRAGSASLANPAQVFAALGDKTRLQIVTRLCHNGPLSIVRLTQGSNVSRQAISKHLHALEGVGLVHSERTGRERIWELRTRRIAETSRYLGKISDQWDEALERLRVLVEDTT